VSDKEMLALAAKAAGIELTHWNDGQEPYSSGSGFILVSNKLWNPLTDDGDALRLAVKLEIEVRNFNGKSHAGRQGQFWCTEAWFPEGDPCAATRRAIVRAAAKLGRA
jgi:hypothetical protein